MPYPTDIEWTDATWNPIGGCSIASPGCGPCYAQKLAGGRLRNHPLYRGTTSIEKGRPIFNGTMTAAPDDADVWTWPLSWRGATNPAQPPKLGPGMPSLIFVADMSDLYHENRPRKYSDRIVSVARRSKHILQLLTKRPHLMALHFEEIFANTARDVRALYRSTLWLGTSAERQKEFDERWPHLRRLAELGFVVFISYEPAMGPLALPRDFLALGDRAQLIAGGCSGERAWPAHPDWFRRVRDDCADAGVPFFFKQWGEWAPEDQISVAVPIGTATRLGFYSAMYRVGKKAAGALLDGVEHRAFPRIAAPAIGAAA
jgi:protein gp37